MPRVIVGLGGLLNDAACCVLVDGTLASAVEQTKLTRYPTAGFPDDAIEAALQIAKIGPENIDCIALARPFSLNEESMALWRLRDRFPKAEVIVIDHHEAHASSAYFASGFSEASVLSVDRAGDYRSAVLFHGSGKQLTKVRELYFPDSIGDLYNRVTELLGFKPRSDEHKVQWLSTAGKPKFQTVFRDILKPSQKGWPQFDRSFFDADRLSKGGFSNRFHEALGESPEAADIAASLQAAVEEIICLMLDGAKNVAIAGGLALNALIARALEKKFASSFVQPAAGNAGTALGAAFYAWHSFYGEDAPVNFNTLCLGPEFSPQEIKQVLENCKLRFRFLPTDQELIQGAISALRENKIVAWMQGRMEFGPRALGRRSILASPLDPYSTENLNVYIKHREGFRKFAASVPAELAGEYFHAGRNARYLATVSEVRKDYQERFSAAILNGELIRVHLVDKEESPLYHALLLAMGKATGLPVLYNTSFNLFGDPLVCSPRDAVRSFYSSGIDTLFVGRFSVEK
jgi:carbamoyltransferase